MYSSRSVRRWNCRPLNFNTKHDRNMLRCTGSGHRKNSKWFMSQSIDKYLIKSFRNANSVVSKYRVMPHTRQAPENNRWQNVFYFTPAVYRSADSTARPCPSKPHGKIENQLRNIWNVQGVERGRHPTMALRVTRSLRQQRHHPIERPGGTPRRVHGALHVVGDALWPSPITRFR